MNRPDETASAAPAYALFGDIAAEVEVPRGGILSRTIYAGSRLKAIVFGFDAGEELSEHTASSEAVIQILRGEATLTLGADTIEAGPGTWVHMPARLPHGLQARTPVVMLLLMLLAPD